MTIVDLKIEFKSGNAAFDADPQGETLTIVDKVRERISDGVRDGICRDTNGNRVGEWYLDIAPTQEGESA